VKKLTKIAVTSSVLSSLAPVAALAQNYDYSYNATTAAADSVAATGFLGAYFGILIFLLIIGFIFFIFWIFMLVDCIKRTNWKKESDKTVWLIVLIAGAVIGLFLGGILLWIVTIVYYFAVKRALDKGGKTPPPTQPQTPSQPTQS
jgi:hypothetical protein